MVDMRNILNKIKKLFTRNRHNPANDVIDGHTQIIETNAKVNNKHLGKVRKRINRVFRSTKKN